MATHQTAKIKKNRIVKMGIYDNHTSKKTMATIYAELQNKYPGKEVYIQNCGFFDMSNLKPCFGVKAAGTELASDWNYGWIGVNGKTIGYGAPGSSPKSYTDAITGFPVLVTDGKKSPLFSTKNVDNSDRGRTMLGFNDDEVILSCISDVAGTSDFTLNEEVTYMLNQKCTAAINLDGGGSSQCNFNGSKVTSSRKVSNFFYVIANVDTSTPERKVQTYLNNTYKAGLVVDGLLGPATKKAIIKAAQTEFGLSGKDVDGSWGPKSKSMVKSLGINSKNNTVARVKVLQCALCRCGYWNSDINGKFTEELDAAVRSFQKAKRLVVDGWAGTATFTALFA